MRLHTVSQVHPNMADTILSADDVRHIATLAAIDIDDDAVEQMRQQLSGIFGHFQRLQEVDTQGLEPTSHTTDANTVMREDVAAEPLPRDEVLANAPDPDGEFVRVRPVLE